MCCLVKKGLVKQKRKAKFQKTTLTISKRANLSTGLLLPAMQEVQESIDDVLSRTDLSKDEKEKRSAFSCSTDA